jgi:hypothetical protein
LLTVTSPDVAVPFTVSRASDLTVSWTSAASAAAVYVVLIGSDPSLRATVTCVYESTMPAGVVPSAALMELPAGPGSMAVSTIATATTSAGAWQIEVRAGFTAVSDEGTPFSTTTMFE